MKIENLIRENIKSLKPYSSARSKNLNGILLDANENGYSDNVYQEFNFNRYPDPNQTDLRKVMAKYLSVSYENLLFGVGSDEIIDLLVRIFCEPGKDNVIINIPTYGMYKVVADINNIEIQNVSLTENFQLDIIQIKKSINQNTKMIFICSPNNPTGNLIKSVDILNLAESANCMIVVDEAYIEFDESNSLLTKSKLTENVIVTRTFSKAWGLAGLRCGYCYADKTVIEYLLRIKAPYNLNSFTMNIIQKTVENFASKNEIVNKIITQKNILKNVLNELKFVLKIYESNTNFLLIKTDNSSQLLEFLSNEKIIIRDRSNETGLENCVRISVGNEEENSLLISKLRKYNEKYFSVRQSFH